VLIHPDHGLWHAYRAALLFAVRLDVPPRDGRPAPCATCRDRPCLTTCPVGAFTDTGYDVERCVDHIVSPAGRTCREQGCLARRACPVGSAYAPAQQAFHMQAFLRSRLKAREGRG
jgi:Fe-S-cluster-containing hydrogenase component 2